MIGAGAAGIMAARRAAEVYAMGSGDVVYDTRARNVMLFEKTSRIGTKILISGGGKCNITHDGPIEDVLEAFRPNEARFIRPSCYRLTNDQIIGLLTDRGLRVYTREDGRIFPVDQTAKDVVAILQRMLDEVGVETKLNCPVTGIQRDEVGVCRVTWQGGEQATRHVVLAVGGSSYPKSGTTGDGWAWAASLGHTIVPVRAALAPIDLKDTRWREYSGVALRDCVLKARLDGKEIARWRGDLLFTHTGVSGPCALGVSREVAEAMEHGNVSIEVDVLPDKTFETVAQELVNYASANPRRKIGTMLDDVLPSRLVDELALDAGIPEGQVFADLSRLHRNRLVECLKGWKLGDVREVPLGKGEVVAGGIALDEVDPQTMLSKKCPGLYCCGEALDIAGPVGGYNLQAAFATGWVAGESASKL